MSDASVQIRAGSRHWRGRFAVLVASVVTLAATLGSFPQGAFAGLGNPGSGGSINGDLAGAQTCWGETMTFNGQPSKGVIVFYPGVQGGAAPGLDSGGYWWEALPSMTGNEYHNSNFVHSNPDGTPYPPGSDLDPWVNDFSLPAGVESPTLANGAPRNKGAVVAWFNPPGSGPSTSLPGPLSGDSTFSGGGVYGPSGYSWACYPADSFIPPPPPTPGNFTINCVGLDTSQGYTGSSGCGVLAHPPNGCIVSALPASCSAPPPSGFTASINNGNVTFGSNPDFVVYVPTTGYAVSHPWQDPSVAVNVNWSASNSGTGSWTGFTAISFYRINDVSGSGQIDSTSFYKYGTPGACQGGSGNCSGVNSHDSASSSSYLWNWYGTSSPTSQWYSTSGSPQPPWSGLNPAGNSDQHTYTSVYGNAAPPRTGYTVSTVQFWAVECTANYTWTWVNPVSGAVSTANFTGRSRIAYSGFAGSGNVTFASGPNDLCNGKWYYKQTFTEPGGAAGPPHPIVQFEPVGLTG